MITYTDDLRRLAWGTDAGFYRLVPKKVILSENEEEVRSILSDSSKNKIPVTFRAAGTSLSGQSISDSILLVAGKNWEGFSVSEDAGTITLQPGIVGARVNAILKPFGRRPGIDRFVHGRGNRDEQRLRNELRDPRELRQDDDLGQDDTRRWNNPRHRG